MTERGAGALRRDANNLAIGRSEFVWHNDKLTVSIDEVCAPWPMRVRGTLTLRPSAVENTVHCLDAAGRHRWSPVAPCARVEVSLEQPALCWRGQAYFDRNDGDAPLEQDFRCWDWSRAPTRRGATVIYEPVRRDGTTMCLATHYDRRGSGIAFIPPPRVRLAPTKWGIARATCAESGQATVHRTLEDTPFYARSLVSTQIQGETTMAMHESLSLDRFASPIVQAMLPFRMPRVFW